MSSPFRIRCVVFHDSSTSDIAQWLTQVLKRKVENIECVRQQFPEEAFFKEFQSIVDAPPTKGDEGEEEEKKTFFSGCDATLIVTVFFDGQSPTAKTVFGCFKEWVVGKPQVVLQALNSKKGAHTLFENEAVVVATLMGKVPPAPSATATATAGGNNNRSKEDTAASKQDQQEEGKETKLQQQQDQATATAQEEVFTPESLAKKIYEGQGEIFVTVAVATDKYEEKVAELKKAAAAINCGVQQLLTTPKPINPQQKKGEPTMLGNEFLLRQSIPGRHIELRMAMCGNVDSGKSTLTSVLTRGVKDDGRGSARARVFNHKHEADTGRTSSISENYLGFDGEGNVVNYPLGGATNLSLKHNTTAAELANKSAKIVTLYDLAGHERYLKTTVLGMTRSLPEYACVVISANNGIQRMTKEHLGLCLALKLPFFIVVTRIDAAPENIHQQTMSNILKLLKMPTVKKLPYPVKKHDDVIVCAKNLKADRITPIFEVSNVAGTGIDNLSCFINLLPVRKDWLSMRAQPKEMIVDSTFFVTGVGTVVGGVITQGSFKPNDTVMMGPDALGHFRPVQVKSIHVKGVEVDQVDAGNDAALCLKKEKRNAIRKGNVLICPSANPKAHWQFEGEILILYHSTTISSNYEPVIHSQTVRQSAKILLINQEVLRTGDRAIVHFHFLYRPEYIKVGHRLVFREGRTKGIGTVTRIIEGFNESVLHAPKSTRQQQQAQIHLPKDKDHKSGEASSSSSPKK